MQVTMVSNLRHGDIRKAAKAVGSLAELGRRLGVSYGTVVAWSSMRACPPTTPEEIHPQSKWTPERITQLESDLFALTGKVLEELFPPELRHNTAFLKQRKEIEATREVEIAQLESRYADRMLLPDPSEAAEKNELQGLVETAMSKLTARERTIVEMRFGLNGHDASDLREIGEVLGVTRERVRQIETKAIRKLQDPSFASMLVSAID